MEIIHVTEYITYLNSVYFEHGLSIKNINEYKA